jgi:hypothetical protein
VSWGLLVAVVIVLALVGRAMRTCMTDIYRLVRTLTGATAEQARDFMARGMLINTLVALRMPEHRNEDPAIAELVHHTLQPPIDPT